MLFGNTIKITALSLLFLISASCKTKGIRFKESGFNSAFPSVITNETPFADYVVRMKKIIRKTRVDLKTKNSRKTVDANAPFILEPPPSCPKQDDGKYKKGILLIHGLSDSPYLLKDIAKHLQSKCFLVYAILLPGHGTVPGDLLTVNYKEWIRAGRYGTQRLKKKAEDVYAGGYSTGASVVIQMELKHPSFAGITLFSPAFGVSGNAVFAPYLKTIYPWLSIHGDDDFAKYESFTTNAAAQIHYLIKDINRLVKKGKKVTAPIFTAFSYDDHTVDSQKSLNFLTENNTSNKSRFNLYHADADKVQGLDKRVTAINATLPDENIITLSHISITIPPDNPHYGRSGSYQNCLHYKKESNRWRACKDGKSYKGAKFVMGEYGRDSNGDKYKDKYILRRLTYNPFYDEMLKEMDRVFGLP